MNTTKKNTAPLIIEPHPKDYKGYPFITLLQYRKQHFLAIIDNVDDETIKAYVLDFCGPESVDEQKIITIANEWFQNNSKKFPVSVEFSRRGVTQETCKILKSYGLEFISRIIGPVYQFPLSTVKSIRRRKRRPISPAVEILSNKLAK